MLQPQFRWIFLLTMLIAGSDRCLAARQTVSVAECRRLLETGQYQDCVEAAAAAIERRAYGEDWPILQLQAERALGRYEDSLATARAGIDRYPWSVRIHFEAWRGAREVGLNEDAQESLKEIDQLAGASPLRYSDADDLVALGHAALAAGADPKDVLEGFFDRARRNFASRPDGFLAAAQLAVDKGDAALAAEILNPVVEQFSDNADILFVHSRAVRSRDPKAAEVSLQAALKINPDLTAAQIFEADRLIDLERFESAEETLNDILERNPHQAEAGALLAAVHHLQNQTEQAAAARDAALQHNPKNPIVDHRLGATLSRRYRFAEGATFQRQALEVDSDYVPAQTQLAQDLLRLGRSDEAWPLIERAHQQDGYNTELFNLLQLRDSLDRFTTLSDENFVVHLPSQEAGVFGDRVLGLLDAARQELTERYGYVPPEPVIVEIFDRPDDFAVRTFGLPDVAGFLGVCFGRVVTANSPTSQRGRATNWESVLWHEFCHVITLQMTSNRIPRWLSEGISVYEERRRDARWGQRMDPAFRERILSGPVTPVSQLSSAFLNAESGADINFAYFESSMVVEFLVERFGLPALLAILQDLEDGLLINDALERRAQPLEELNEEFSAWLKERAEGFASGVDFTAELPEGVSDVTDFLAEHPGHYVIGLRHARQQISVNPEAAEKELLRLVALFPEDSSASGARSVLAELYRRQQRTDHEARVLAEHLERSAEDFESARRLLELHSDAGRWKEAIRVAETVLAIDPANPEVLRQLVEAGIQAEHPEVAKRCLNGLLELDPSSAPQWRYQLAELLRDEDPTAARNQILRALEEAPRYRAAHRLLLQLQEGTAPTAAE